MLEIVHDTHFAPTADFPAQEISNSSKKELKIAYIGGGSREWAVKLMRDLALSTRLAGTLSLYDIDQSAAAHNEALSQVIFSHRQARTQFEAKAENRLEDALRGADVVVISIEPGPTKLRYADLEIPAKYGIMQTVGDTTGPGGILRALRCVPIYQGLAAEIMEHCPNAWVINYTNPMAVCVAALKATAPTMKVFGCCHEVFGTQTMIAQLIKGWFEVEQCSREEIKLDIAGVNHFTWATRVTWQGVDLMPRLREMVADDDFMKSRQADAEAAKANEQWFSHNGLIAYDLLRRFGALGAAGDRHLAEFVPWYLLSEQHLHRWGVVQTPYSWRLARCQSARPSLDEVAREDLEPSGEEGVQQIEALFGLRSLFTNINLPNAGQLPGFPKGAIVETYAQFHRDCVQPVVASALPTGSSCLVRRAIDEQSLTVNAAIERNANTAFQALLTHPLVRIPTDQAWKMFREMLAATREMLPGWKL